MRRLLAKMLAAVVIVAAPLVVVPAPAAQAVGVDLACTGSADLRFTPGLTNTPKSVEVFYDSTVNCPVVHPRNVTRGLGTAIYTITGASCTSLTAATNTTTYNWSPRATTSRVSYTSTSVNLSVVSQIVQTGSVTQGLLAGDVATSTITFVNLNLAACGTSAGLTLVSGTEILSFVSL